MISKNDKKNDADIIDFEKEKSPFVHQRKEEKLKALQKAFMKALPLDTKTLKNKKVKKKRKKKS